MNRLFRILFITLLLSLPFAELAAVEYNDHFTSQRMRADLILTGNAHTQSASLREISIEPLWAGSPNSLIDPFGYGDYFIEVRTKEGEVIYSKGFNTLFREWRDTPQAQTVTKSFTQTIWFPCPKHEVEVVLYERIKSTMELSTLFSFTADPEDHIVKKESSSQYPVTEIEINGQMNHKVDLLIIPEGYTEQQMEKFHNDCRTFLDYFFVMEPYASRRNDFNIWAVDAPSAESGTDIPHENIWRNTILNSSFYTFYVDRYLTVTDHTLMADVASGAPFDAIIVLVNDKKYGGCGIYNSYALGISDNEYALQVFVHEFGHSFAGLADEYYTSEVAYTDFYDMNTEPWEPNITTMVDFGSKWQDMLDKSTPIPTPVKDSNSEVVGVYEGAGYNAKGIFRPFIDCRMKTNKAKGFCPVCVRAINRMIDYYCK